MIQLYKLPANYVDPPFYLEHDEREEHDHTAVDLTPVPYEKKILKMSTFEKSSGLELGSDPEDF